MYNIHRLRLGGLQGFQTKHTYDDMKTISVMVIIIKFYILKKRKKCNNSVLLSIYSLIYSLKIGE